MMNAGIFMALLGAGLSIFGFFIGIEIGFGEFRVMHLPSGLAGGFLFLAGIFIIGFEHAQTSKTAERVAASSTSSNDKWQFLAKYDSEIASAAERARAWGPRFEQELASKYLTVNDKNYLPAILKNLEKSYRKECEDMQSRRLELEHYIDTVFYVQDEMRAALLSDRRAIGFDGLKYRFFDSMADYRVFRKDFDDFYSGKSDLETKLAFSSRIGHMAAEIFQDKNPY